jgi:hypothetical protein
MHLNSRGGVGGAAGPQNGTNRTLEKCIFLRSDKSVCKRTPINHAQGVVIRFEGPDRSGRGPSRLV